MNFSHVLWVEQRIMIFEKNTWEKIVITSLKGSCMANTTINCEDILFIIGIIIKVVNISILYNSLLIIVPMHIKRSKIFNV